VRRRRDEAHWCWAGRRRESASLNWAVAKWFPWLRHGRNKPVRRPAFARHASQRVVAIFDIAHIAMLLLAICLRMIYIVVVPGSRSMLLLARSSIEKKTHNSSTKIKTEKNQHLHCIFIYFCSIFIRSLF
jgi:hypothetical protein